VTSASAVSPSVARRLADVARSRTAITSGILARERAASQVCATNPGSKTPNVAETTAAGTSPSGAARPIRYASKNSTSPMSASAALTGSAHTACMATGSKASRRRRAGVAEATTSGVCTSAGAGAKKNSMAAA
jgi:hypothetical protein